MIESVGVVHRLGFVQGCEYHAVSAGPGDTYQFGTKTVPSTSNTVPCSIPAVIGRVPDIPENTGDAGENVNTGRYEK